MIVNRFMSDDEYKKLMSGKRLYNNTNHRKNGKRTSSVGFCFFKEDPDDAVHWLAGIVNLDWCVTMKVDDGFLVRSVGLYADESKMSLQRRLMIGQQIPMIQREEFCRCRYSLDDVEVVGSTNKYKSMYPTKEEQAEILRYFLLTGSL